MTGVGDHHFPDIGGSGAHDDGHGRPERLFPADRQDRHRQLALGKQCLIVERVLIERGELRKAGMHGAGPGVQLGVMLPRRFVELLRIGREFVPEAIEIDALATCNQPLGIRASE